MFSSVVLEGPREQGKQAALRGSSGRANWWAAQRGGPVGTRGVGLRWQGRGRLASPRGEVSTRTVGFLAILCTRDSTLFHGMGKGAQHYGIWSCGVGRATQVSGARLAVACRYAQGGHIRGKAPPRQPSGARGLASDRSRQSTAPRKRCLQQPLRLPCQEPGCRQRKARGGEFSAGAQGFVLVQTTLLCLICCGMQVTARSQTVYGKYPILGSVRHTVHAP